jgi:predicted acylesterase/phospholipase RssA
MALLSFAITWVRRIPARFTALFVGFMLLYVVFVAKLVELSRPTAMARFVLGLSGLPNRVTSEAIVQMAAQGVVVLALVGAGILGCYNIAAAVYRRTRPRPSCPSFVITPSTRGPGNRLDRFNRIGIVLAGGGAKGAYQAGAMRAIHEFLEEHDALEKVKMISGTSIGSWNAMFWLAGLVKPPAPDGGSLHERWWQEISLGRVVEFDTYWPLGTNHFVRATPWQETFEDVFVRNADVRRTLASLFNGSQGEPPHFYFTRSNVARGILEFSTNYSGLAHRTKPNLRPGGGGSQPIVSLDRYEIIDDASDAAALFRMRDAVFASMDLPPLFPYVYRQHGLGHFYEDGGVVDNLPVWFATEIEQCDLLFILPLNASFEEPVNHRSIVRRLFRVMDVRQGVLERNSLKLAYLYNELAALRSAPAAGAAGPGAWAGVGLASTDTHSLAGRAMARHHDPVSVFAICPQQPLAINTSEFWKPRAAAEAFELMYTATRTELSQRFEELTDPTWLRMTLVAPQGERLTIDEF